MSKLPATLPKSPSSQKPQKSDNSVLHKASVDIVAAIDGHIATLDKNAKYKANKQRFAQFATQLPEILEGFRQSTYQHYSRFVRSEGMPATIVTALKHLSSAATQAKRLAKSATAKVSQLEKIDSALAAVRAQLTEARELLLQEYVRDDSETRAAIEQRDKEVARHDKEKFSNLFTKYAKYEKKIAVVRGSIFTVRSVPIAVRFESAQITPTSLKKLGFTVEQLSVNVSDKKQQLGLVLEDQMVLLISTTHASANMSREAVGDYGHYNEAVQGEQASLRSLRKQLAQVQAQRAAATTPTAVRQLERKIEVIEESIAEHEEAAKAYVNKRASAKKIAPKLSAADALYRFADKALSTIKAETGTQFVIANKLPIKSTLNPEYIAFWILEPYKAKMLENLTNGKTAARWSFAWK